MWQGWAPLQERAKQASVDASTSYALEFDQVKVGEHWEIPNISVRDNTSSPSRIDVYLSVRGWEHFVGQRQPAVAGYVYTLDRPFWCPEGGKVVVRFVGGGSADEVEAWITGRRWLADPMPVARSPEPGA